MQLLHSCNAKFILLYVIIYLLIEVLTHVALNDYREMIPIPLVSSILNILIKKAYMQA